MFKKYKFYPFFELNISFILMSTSGILGKIIPLPPSLIIFWRSILAGALLWGYLVILKRAPVNWRKHWQFFVGTGMLLAIHWTTYFEALKLGGVAIGMLSLFTYPVITSIIEPWVVKGRHSWFDILSSLLVLGGLALIVGEFSLGSKALQGALLGILSAILYSFRNIFSRGYIKTYDGSTIMCYQLFVAAILLSPSILLYPAQISAHTWGHLLILVIVTTAIAHTLFVQGLAHFTTTSVSIMSTLIPVYGILWAVWLAEEVITEGIVWGGSIIIIATIAQNVRRYQNQQHAI